jgi:hypothetical protein
MGEVMMFCKTKQKYYVYYEEDGDEWYCDEDDFDDWDTLPPEEKESEPSPSCPPQDEENPAAADNDDDLDSSSIASERSATTPAFDNSLSTAPEKVHSSTSEEAADGVKNAPDLVSNVAVKREDTLETEEYQGDGATAKNAPQKGPPPVFDSSDSSDDEIEIVAVKGPPPKVPKYGIGTPIVQVRINGIQQDRQISHSHKAYSFLIHIRD